MLVTMYTTAKGPRPGERRYLHPIPIHHRRFLQVIWHSILLLHTVQHHQTVWVSALQHPILLLLAHSLLILRKLLARTTDQLPGIQKPTWFALMYWFMEPPPLLRCPSYMSQNCDHQSARKQVLDKAMLAPGSGSSGGFLYSLLSVSIASTPLTSFPGLDFLAPSTSGRRPESELYVLCMARARSHSSLRRK